MFEKFDALVESITFPPSAFKARPKRDDAPPPSPQQSESALDAFIEQYKRTAGQKKAVVRALLALPSKDYRVTGFMTKMMGKVSGVVLNAYDESKLTEMNKLLGKKNLGPITDFQIRNSVHYGKYVDGMLVTLMTTTTAKLGSPFRIAVSVDWIVSIDGDHSAFTMIEQLKREVARRRQMSYLFTQCSNARSAKKFWEGRFSSHSQWADMFVGLFNIYDSDYKIYEDASNMMA
tara:strand:- start:29 stop:727 length:699 start_codon:yes stop_codon:yes gene_type:complete